MKGLLLSGLGLGLCVFIAYFGQSMGLQHSTANKSAFICSTNVIWVALVQSIRSKSFNLQTWVCVGFAILGSAILELQGSSAPAIEDLWLLLQPIGFGTGYVLLEGVMKNYPEQAGAISGLKLLVIGMFSLLWAASTGQDMADLQAVLASPPAVAGLIYTGLVTTAGGIWLQSVCFKKVPATDASIILSSEPIWAAIFASFLLGEHVSATDAVGGSAIILACLANEFDWVTRAINYVDSKKAV
jgi:drug/metabolite transporter (DMT)-like permease